MFFDSATLRNWYNEFRQKGWFPNDELFIDGNRIMFKVTHNTRQLGCFRWKDCGSFISKTIQVSDYYDSTEDELKNVLIHEMCHLYCFLDGFRYERHGKHWQYIANYVSRRSGYNITRCAEGRDLVVAKQYKEKEERKLNRNFVFIVTEGEDSTNKNKVHIRKISKNIFINNINDFNESIVDVSGDRIRIFIGSVFPNWKVFRSTSRYYYMPMDKFRREYLPFFEEKCIELDRPTQIYNLEVF